MGDCFDKAGSRPDGGHGLFGQTTVRPELSEFSKAKNHREKKCTLGELSLQKFK
jgi:hypothetical protein